ncbi:MAG: COQ9 family protein [Pseudomonadota bacterium]
MPDSSHARSLAHAKDEILKAAIPHVLFDGWVDSVITLAVNETGIDENLVLEAFPRGAIDLALFYHASGDCAMVKALAAADLDTLRFSEKVAYAVQARLEIADKEAVRRGLTLFALPQNATDGVSALWSTVDTIWTALGDTDDDVNWYTKRATLSGVYSATVLYWLGDESESNVDTWAFLNRRIENVMQFEKVKSAFKKSPLGPIFDGATQWIKAPNPDHKSMYPGYTGGDHSDH